MVSKKKKVFTKIETDFSAEIGNSNVFFAQNQVVSKKKKKKKKKKVFAKIETDFSAGFVTFRSVGGDASRDGAELFKIRVDFSAKIVTFRLVGGDASPPSPPLNPPLLSRPRTGMLEAKDQGTSASALQKKKVFTKIFQAISKKKGLHKNFSSNLHKTTLSKKFFKRSTNF